MASDAVKTRLEEIHRSKMQVYEAWKSTSILEGIENEEIAANTAVLLQNVWETYGGGSSMITETTFSGANAGYDWSAQDGTAAANDVSPYLQYLFPLVRRVYPNLIANDLVGVQPMNGPVGLVFYLKWRYEGLVDNDAVLNDPRYGVGRRTEVASNKGRTAPGTEYANFVGNTWSIDPYYSLQTVFRENATAITTVNSSAVAAGGAITIVLDEDPTQFLAQPVVNNSISVSGQITVNVDDTAGAGGVADDIVVAFNTANGTATIVGTGNAATIAAGGTAQYNNATNQITITFTVSDVAGSGNAAAEVNTVTVDSAAATYDYNMEGNSQLPEIQLEISSYPVQAKTRKLRTKWTIESQQDLQKMHNVDAESELTAVLSNEIIAEIDREIINDLLNSAAIRVTYNYSHPLVVGGDYVTAGVGAAGQVIPGVTTFDDRNKALLYQILEVSNQIYRQSLRGAGNWIVTSPEIASKLESLLEFRPEPDTNREQYNLGIVFSGTLNNRFRLYKDPLFPVNYILVGYKGNTFFDAGFFYCPYIPVELTEVIQDPNTFNRVRGILTRYGKVLVENGGRMYGVIRVEGLTAVGADVLPGSNVTTTPHVSTDGLTNALAGSDLI